MDALLWNQAEQIVLKQKTKPTVFYAGEDTAALFSRPNATAQVYYCLQFLRFVNELSIARRELGSVAKQQINLGPYGVKHSVERWCGRYIMTVCWLAAAEDAHALSTHQNWKVDKWLADLINCLKVDSRGEGSFRHQLSAFLTFKEEQG